VVLVDTNVLAYLMIEGDRTAAAQELFGRDPDWRSEGFVMIELANVLTTYVRAGALAHSRAMRLLAEAQGVVPALVSVPHARALEAALQHGISAYDGRFIALAMQSGRRLVTEDAGLRRAVPDWTLSLAEALAA
jgi:predicted nucleic acid-binding protein